MNAKRYFWLIGILLIALAFFVACATTSGDDDDDDDDTVPFDDDDDDATDDDDDDDNNDDDDNDTTDDATTGDNTTDGDTTGDDDTTVPDVNQGDLLITEIMINPAALDDTAGEWVEIYNTTGADIDIQGLVLKDAAKESHTIESSVVVTAGGYAVLARSETAVGAGVDYVYASFQLSNTEDEVILATPADDVIAQVVYNETDFPILPGASMNLDPDAFDFTDAQNAANWCAATIAYDTGDLGSPGAANEDCAGGDDDDDDDDNDNDNDDDDNDDDDSTPSGEIYFSEYIEGSSENKAIEIYNDDTGTATLTGCAVVLYRNGSATPSATTDISAETIAAGDVLVVCDPDSDPAILAECDVTTNNANWNGNDAIELACSAVTLDVFGKIGEEPAAGFWGTGDNITENRTLVRDPTIRAGDPNGGDAFDPADEWDWHAQDTFTFLGAHTVSD
ncbi:MAG: lamin tail domain-containing protein [Candidatus Lernaella stagnicola]|nr:lamin tail domain-containing protein [Candidatus Lernaella stagnicola]